MAADEQITKFLDGIVGVVEADSFSSQMLWEENERRISKRTWISNGHGLIETVGFYTKRPVCISLFVSVIDDKRILFWHATSELVDYRLIKKWMEENIPATARREGGRINKTDANNFHNVFPIDKEELIV